jgi:hypothetical protein
MNLLVFLMQALQLLFSTFNPKTSIFDLQPQKFLATLPSELMWFSLAACTTIVSTLQLVIYSFSLTIVTASHLQPLHYFLLLAASNHCLSPAASKVLPNISSL